MDEVQEAVNGIEIREQEHREADAERDKRIPRNERILRNCVTNPNGTISTL